MGIQSYRDLKVWQTGMDLAEECYLVTRNFPKEELYGLISQIRRASASIPANMSLRGMVEKPEKNIYSFYT